MSGRVIHRGQYVEFEDVDDVDYMQYVLRGSYMYPASRMKTTSSSPRTDSRHGIA